MNIKPLQIEKRAFTLIEVIMSVIIVAIVVMGAMQVQEQNSDMATYLLKRGNSELDNAVFLTEKVQRYSKDEKNAYDMLVDEFSIKDFDSRDILKKIVKKINITEAEAMPVGGTEDEPPLFVFYASEILLNGNYPARYYTFK
jgi:prepilin-type N-terminal cleavage/methylation domain-containing protein